MEKHEWQPHQASLRRIALASCLGTTIASVLCVAIPPLLAPGLHRSVRQHRHRSHAARAVRRL